MIGPAQHSDPNYVYVKNGELLTRELTSISDYAEENEKELLSFEAAAVDGQVYSYNEHDVFLAQKQTFEGFETETLVRLKTTLTGIYEYELEEPFYNKLYVDRVEALYVKNVEIIYKEYADTVYAVFGYRQNKYMLIISSDTSIEDWQTLFEDLFNIFPKISAL
jgi:hypothetical protein